MEHLVSAFFLLEDLEFYYIIMTKNFRTAKRKKNKDQRPCEELVVVVNVEKCTIANIYS